jgi:iron complex outermembrane receptor protein
MAMHGAYGQERAGSLTGAMPRREVRDRNPADPTESTAMPRSTCVAAAVTAALLPGSWALAQETSGLEEIVVTAQRREQNLQETPVTVTAISAAQLENQAIGNTQDIGKAVPNLQLLPVTANPSAFQIGLRGGSEQTGGLIVSEPVVGLYVDDVYRGRLQGANFQLSDVERIEVLRGPQGTLYGRNTFSGAIRIVTRTPSADNEWLNASIGTGSHNEINGSFSVGRALTDTLAGSLAVLYRDQRDGWVFNRAQNKSLGAEQNLAVRGKLAYRDGPWDAVLSVSYGDDDNDGYVPGAIRFDPPGAPTGRATARTTDEVRPRYGTDPYVAEYPQPSLGKTETRTVTLNVGYDFGGVTLRSITGYVDLADGFRWDLAAGQNPSPGVYLPSFDRLSEASAKQWTQELQLLGDSLEGRLNWIAGLYYFNESGDQTLTDDIPLFGLRNLAPTFLSIDTESWAVFGQGTWKFTDRMSGTLGARYSRDAKAFDASIQSGFGVPVPRTDVSLDRSFSSFTPKAGLDYKFTDTVFGYVAASKGFKAGGYNGLSVLNPLVLSSVYEPQDVWTYEAGIKAEWFERRLRTNVTFFVNDISDLQQTATVGAGSFAQQNVGDATVRGIEAEITAQPTDGLTLFANLGLQDNGYDQLNPASQAATAGATDLPLVPGATAQFGFNYEMPVGDSLAFKLGASGRYTDDFWVEVTNSLLVKSYTRYDAFIGLGTQDGKWEARLTGTNLSDEANWVSGIVTVPQPALTLLRPREWMLRVNFRLD